MHSDLRAIEAVTTVEATKMKGTKMKGLILALALAVPAIGSSASSTPDAAFYKHAAEGGMAEVELGNLAQQKSTSSPVKDFGALMVKDHSAANDKLKAIAASKDISLPKSPSMSQMATKVKLEALSGDTFDKSYVTGMIKDHQEDIAMFEREAASGQDPDAKAFAAATLPTLRTHLQKIQSIAAASGVAAR
jgi:putative membrane protein